ncbi:MAG TPA: baseplate J/gp47 family protein [Anaerolineales bacterium]|nr:baseplate J/gp47 family protein [Anaerolineales bacterium]
MKTQILQLEQHDDVNSIRDKMGWGQTTRTLLVWPPGSRNLHRKLDLLLLQRHCKALGSQLALVSDNDEIRFHARDLSVPVFDTIPDAQNGRWINPRRAPRKLQRAPVEERLGFEGLSRLRDAAHPGAPAWTKNPWLRLGVFGAGVAAILAIAGMFVPSAEIRLQPAQTSQEVNFSVQSSSETQAISPAGVIPAREIRVIVEGRERLPTSGQVRLPHMAAEGTIRFTNLTETAVTIPAGTVVRSLGTDPARFATQSAGTVQAGPGEATTLPVEALTRGSRGNLPPGSLVAIEGPLGLSLTATNPFSTHSGTDVDAPAPTVADRQELEAILLDSLGVTAVAEIEAALNPGEFLITHEPELVEVVGASYTPEASEAAENLELHLQAEFRALAVPMEAVQFLAGSVLDASLPEGFAPAGGPLEIENVTQPVEDPDGVTRWEVRARRSLSAQIDGSRVAELSLGRPPEDALLRLQNGLDLDREPEIMLSPSWWPRLPYLSFQIRLSLSGESESLAAGYARPGR